MSMQTLNMGIIGCGDFLRWQSGAIKKSQNVAVKALFDPETARAAKYAADLGGTVAASAEAILKDKAIDTVCLFVPPWVRKDLLVKAARKGKQIITTKPLGPSVKECAAMVKAVEKANVRCGVLYRRTDYAAAETLKDIFAGGEIGRLAIYRQDWLHHYPEWNRWATDPAKNGGPFMDAMIHNMNIARYLMGRPATACAYFSDNRAHPSLACNDTEFMKLDFDGGTAHLFITWAADLAVFSREGNDREHIDIFYMVTDQGWRVTEGRNKDNAPVIIASREGKTREWPVKWPAATPFDAFAASIATGAPQPRNIPTIREAYEDIKLLKDAEKHLGRTFKVSLG
jgi:predicted dehydrogenase